MFSKLSDFFELQKGQQNALKLISGVVGAQNNLESALCLFAEEMHYPALIQLFNLPVGYKPEYKNFKSELQKCMYKNVNGLKDYLA